MRMEPLWLTATTVTYERFLGLSAGHTARGSPLKYGLYSGDFLGSSSTKWRLTLVSAGFRRSPGPIIAILVGHGNHLRERPLWSLQSEPVRGDASARFVQPSLQTAVGTISEVLPYTVDGRLDRVH